MDFCFLERLIVVLLIHHCKSEDLSNASLPSTEVTPQHGEASPQEPQLPPADVVPVVAPPSLKEVAQAVQEASEQAEGWGAEEVLKELLERVVEAALGEVGGGSEGKVKEAEEQEAVEEEVLGAGNEDAEADVEIEAEVGVVEQAAEEEEVVLEDIGAKGGDAGGGNEQEVADPGVEEVKGEVEAVEVVGEGKGVVEGEGEAASVKETMAPGEFGGAAEEQEVIDESPVDPEVTQEVVEETVASLGEVEGEVAGEATGVDGKEGQEVLEEGAAETEIQETVEVPAVVERESEQEIVVDSDPSLGVVDVEQTGGVGEEGEKETQGGEVEGGGVVVQVLPDDHEDIKTTQSVVGEPVEEKDEEETVKDAEGGTLVLEGGDAEEEEAGGRAVVEAAGGEGDGGSVIKEESVALWHDGVDQQASKAAGEEQTAVETSHASQAENQEVLVIPAAEPRDGAGGEETPIEQGPEDQAAPVTPSLGGGETGRNTIGGEALLQEESNHANEIITSTHDLLPHDPAVAEPTLDNFVEDVPATPPQSEGEEPGQANELVEDTSVTSEAAVLGLEAWKIGAICVAVFLVLETVVIIIYILKCRSKSNSTPASQRACEEGCVEPEAATGGNCNDDILPADNGEAQQIAALDPSGVASTLAQNKEQQEEEQAIAISDLPPSSAEESANSGPGPDSSQDLRTSIL